MSKYELRDESDFPFPLGGMFGYWGYELNRSLSSKLALKASRDTEVPDLCAGFYDSLCVFDHQLGKCFVVSTGLLPDGSRSLSLAEDRVSWWENELASTPSNHVSEDLSLRFGGTPMSNLSRQTFVDRVARAQRYIKAGDVYQINLSHRLEIPFAGSWFDFYARLTTVSPAPYAALLDFNSVKLASASPESFLRISGKHIRTRPIKGTRPRSDDPQKDARLSLELQSSEKELAELIMITDLLRNDLGRICEFGSVQVPELIRLERFQHVQHLVSTVEGRLTDSMSHVSALASCFPGGSITGAPKIRAMQIIDELETVARGPYTGAIGFIGFNQESQLSIAIRTAYATDDRVYFSIGAGIVADSDPEAEYEETIAKGRGFLETIGIDSRTDLLTPKERNRGYLTSPSQQEEQLDDQLH